MPTPIRACLKAIAERHRRGDATEHSHRGDLETLLRASLSGTDITNEPCQKWETALLLATSADTIQNLF